MFGVYKKQWVLHEDDKFGIRTRYGNKSSFTSGKHRYIWIENSDKQLTPNFISKEFFSECQIHEGHYLDSLLVVGIQVIREAYGTPIIINSSYRDYHCNRAAGGVNNSQHLYANALDFKFSDWWSLNLFQTEILNNGCIFGTLTSIGVTGFGLYDIHSHIDTRDNAWQYNYFGNRYNLWGPITGLSESLNLNQCEPN